MVERSLLHSIRLDKEKCIGCVACMKICPTRAIRVRDRKAIIQFERCIDCGECLRICPYQAIVPIITSSQDINVSRYKVALPSPVLYSQFGHEVMPDQILSLLKEIGFDSVYDEALVCEITSTAIEQYLEENKTIRPVISSTCPVVVRLIQRLFPSLCKNIIPIEPPREIAAKNLKMELAVEKNIKEENISIVHVTPCAAKMVSISHPETMARSHLDGAISIREIYNRIMMKLKKTDKASVLKAQHRISGIGLGWAISGGEIRGLRFTNTIAVSGVYDTIKILEDVESGKLRNIEYLECMICPDGCVGGPLAVENRFIAKSNMLMLMRSFGDKKIVESEIVKKLYNKKFFSFEHGVKPKPFAPLDNDRIQAIKKLKLKEKILKGLPMIDCGLCGAPDCQTLAEDIVREEANIEDCIFYKEGRQDHEKTKDQTQ